MQFIDNEKNNVICIIGMHRSGTSMVARLLNLCGLDLGPSNQLMPPHDGNPLGYFENMDFSYKIDDALLTHLGGSWDNPPNFKEDWEYDPSLEQIVEEAKGLIITFSKSPRWGWKDPRTTILLPFWKSLIPNLKFVICVRSPLEVAQSLAKRDKITISQGAYLWNYYMRAAIRDTEGCPRIFTFYEDFFNNASGEINRLVKFCGLKKPDDITTLHNAIHRDLKHHTSETSELLKEHKVLAEYKLFYIGLRAIATTGFLYPATEHTPEALISENACGFYKLLEQFHNEQKMAQLQSKLVELELEHHNLEGKAENLENIIAEKEKYIHQLREQTEHLERETAEKDKNARELIEKRQHLEKVLIEQVEDHERVLAKNKETIKNLECSIKTRDIQISALKDFEKKIKNNLLYRIYRFLRFDKIYARLGGKGELQVPKKLLLICPVEIELIRPSIEYLRSQYHDHEINLLMPKGNEGSLKGQPGIFSVYVYRRYGEKLWREYMRVLKELWVKKFALVVLVHPTGYPTPYLNLFILFSSFVKAHRHLIFDEDLKIRALPLRRAILSALDTMLFKIGLPIAQLGTKVALFFGRRIHEKGYKEPKKKTRSGTIAFLLPILPDISHTFVYREVLNILAQWGHERRILVVALEKGRRSPLHDEAKELLAHAVFVPFSSLTQYLAIYFYYLLSRPLRLAKLIDFYSLHSHQDPWFFLRMENFHVLHPMRGIMLARLLEKEDVSYIHCHGMSYPGTRALVASKLLDVPFSISTFVDFEYEYAFKNLKEKIQAARFVVACTQFCKNAMLELSDISFDKKIHVIHHALASQYGSTKTSCSVEPVKSTPDIFIACRLVEKKGLDYLIQACSLLKDREISHRCLIIGDGQEQERLEGLVNRLDLVEEVHFWGALSNHRIWEIVGPEDICIVPSVYCSDGERDGIPVILLEAMAHGHPVVSTYVSGIPELITDGVNGLLVPERNPEALANAIEMLIKDGKFRSRLILEGRETVRKDFNIRDKATQLWTLIERNVDSAFIY